MILFNVSFRKYKHSDGYLSESGNHEVLVTINSDDQV